MRHNLEQILEDSRSPGVGLRKRAARELCPCELKADHPEADVLAVLEGMYDDPDLKLRRSVRQRLAGYRRSGRINHHSLEGFPGRLARPRRRG